MRYEVRWCGDRQECVDNGIFWEVFDNQKKRGWGFYGERSDADDAAFYLNTFGRID